MERLTVKGLDYSYGSLKAIKDVNFGVRKGEIFCLVGPNGSGKSTLIKCIDGILRPDKGKISLDGKDLSVANQAEKARLFAYVPQKETRTFPSTVFDTVLMGRKPYVNWKSNEEDLKAVSRALKRLGIEDLSTRNVGELSGGQKRKVTIARALAQEPELLLLDEPTANLDLRNKLEVMEILEDLSREGLASLLALHDLTMAGRYADRSLMLEDGEVHDCGKEGVLSPENIESVYGVRVNVEEKKDRAVVVPEETVG